MKNFPLTIVDNFFDDPEPVVDLANYIGYTTPGETTFPGVVSSCDITEINYPMINWMMCKITNLFYDLDRVYVTWTAETGFQKIQPYDDKDQFHILNRGIPHLDLQNNLAAGVIYLNKNFCKDAGTSIYQKKKGSEFYKTSREFVDATKKYHSGYTIENYEEILKSHLNKFEETVRVQPKFNRLILYSSDVWHCQTTYGKKSKGDRLTLRFFVNIDCQEQHLPLNRYYE